MPPSRIAARRIRACAARARTANPPGRGLGIAAVTVLRTVDGRSPQGSETDRGDVRAASPTLQLHVAVADRRTGACIGRAPSLVTRTTTESAPESAAVAAVLNFTSARRTARPLRRDRVSAVADGDERRDTPPDNDAAVTA